jgi:ELWxxDGT repeat protein
MNGVAFRGGYLFNAGDVEHGRELWFSDGTEAGTHLVKDINPGPALSSPLDITAVGGIAFFSIVKQSNAGDNTVLTELWRTDGTAAGTTLVWQAPGRFNGYTIRGLTSVGGALLFSAPTRADANGLAIDFEPYILSVRGPRDRNDGPVTTDDDDASADDDAATETPATIDEVGMPTERSNHFIRGG